MSTLKTIWNNKAKIFEGLKNNIFKSEHVEEIAAARAKICNQCSEIDHEGSSCLIPGTQPCCSKCGCALKLKLRSLSSACGDEENPKWHALLTPEDEDAIKSEIGYIDEEDEG